MAGVLKIHAENLILLAVHRNETKKNRSIEKICRKEPIYLQKNTKKTFLPAHFAV